MNALAEKVRAELTQYEHPLFVFDARPAAEGVEVLIQYSPPEPQGHTYVFLLRPREIESKQFPWIFQKQLYDCLHDFITERFTCNPHRQDVSHPEYRPNPAPGTNPPSRGNTRTLYR